MLKFKNNIFFYNIILYIIYIVFCRPKTIALCRREFPVSTTTTIIILLFYTRTHTPHTHIYYITRYPKHTLYIYIYSSVRGRLIFRVRVQPSPIYTHTHIFYIYIYIYTTYAYYIIFYTCECGENCNGSYIYID